MRRRANYPATSCASRACNPPYRITMVRCLDRSSAIPGRRASRPNSVTRNRRSPASPRERIAGDLDPRGVEPGVRVDRALALRRRAEMHHAGDAAPFEHRPRGHRLLQADTCGTAGTAPTRGSPSARSARSWYRRRWSRPPDMAARGSSGRVKSPSDCDTRENGRTASVSRAASIAAQASTTSA